MIQVNTKNILFVAGGAFQGIEKIIASRMRTNVIGYSNTEEKKRVDKNNLLQYISPSDLKKFGLIPEIVGRLPILTHLNPLTRDILKRILVDPKNALVKQYKKLFELDGIKLSFDDKVLDYIVDKSFEFKLGARGLRSIVEIILNDAMFELPSNNNTKNLRITLKYAKEKFNKYGLENLRAS